MYTPTSSCNSLILYSVADAANIKGGTYEYTSDLLALEGPLAQTQFVNIPPSWVPVLNSLPDMQFAGYLARGLSEGFKIGFRGTPLRSCRNNMPSVSHKAEAVDHFVREEVHAGRLVQQLETAKVHVSPIGLVPKQGRPDSFRIIVDLSSPPGYSVNDGIDGGWCSLSYTTVSEAARLALSCGTGALMGKVDLKSAYRMVPVHPSDQHLLAIQWRGVTYCDQRLPFGLRSAPKVFNAVADALAWALTVRGVHSISFFVALRTHPYARRRWT